MSEDKVVELERTRDADGQLGTFGFSILGGYGTKFPACVCEVDRGGPADQTNKVQVGDRLLELNGEALQELTSRDLVQRIRHAPSPSTFTLLEDQELSHQITSLLRKKEKRAAEKAKRDRLASTGSQDSVGMGDGTPTKVKRKITPVLIADGGVVGPVEEKKKGSRKLDRIIEVEPSVNTANGQTAGIVKVKDNRIIGRLDNPECGPSPSSSGHTHSRHSSSPHSSQELRFSPIRASPNRDKRSASGSPSRSQLAESGPSTSTPITTNHNISLDSLSTHSSASSTGLVGVVSSADHTPVHVVLNKQDEANREVFDPVAGVNGLQEQVKVVPVLCHNEDGHTPHDQDRHTPLDPDEHASLDQDGHAPSDQNGHAPVVDGEEEEPRARVNSGTVLRIPEWKGHELQSRMGKKPRSSLSEDILIGQLEEHEHHTKTSSEEATPTDHTPNEMRKQESVESESKTPEEGSPSMNDTRAMLSRHRSSKKKRNDYANAVIMARKLYMLDGYRKSEVAAKLADRSEYGQSIAKEYLKFFEFQGQSLDESLRQFLLCFALTGETQERERVVVHFSARYHECNPQAYSSADDVHGVTIALLLLNTDLYNDHAGKKMTLSSFASNLERIDVKLRKDLVKSLYDSIKKEPLKWAEDDDDRSLPSSAKQETSLSPTTSEDMGRVYHVTIPGTFVEVEMSENAPLFKEGYVLKKNVMDGPHKKVSRGKRQWRPYYAYLKGFLLYLERPRGGDLHLEDTSSALSVSHCLAMGAFDYHKKNSVLRVTTSEWQSFLLQANDTMDMQQWIEAINRSAATYSAAPLAAPISSSTVFQRPTYPMAPTKNNREQQIESHESKVKTLTKELEEHQAYKPKGNKAKHNDLQNWFDKFQFLQFEINRFQIYYALLSTNIMVEFKAPLPSGLVPSPSISTLATPGTGGSGSNSDLSAWKSMTPPDSPPSHRNKSAKVKKGSPLLSSKAKGHNLEYRRQS